MGTALAKTYVWYIPDKYYEGEPKDMQCFFISTINRQSSSMVPGEYAETLVWEYNDELSQRGKLVGQYEDCRDSLRSHMQAIKTFSTHGGLDGN